MELPIVTVNAMALQYDPSLCQWRELGSEGGVCLLSILKSPSNEYRYVAQKISNNEFVLNAYIFPEMKYDETTATFHQWYDKSKNAYGLNFTDVVAAKKFAAGITCALEQLNVPMAPPKSTVVTAERPTVPPGAIPKKTPDSSLRSNSKVSPYATSNVGSGVVQNNSTSAPKVTPVKSSAGAPPPPGPPPSAPAPPGPPPLGPAVTKSSNAPANDFASQLQKAAADHKQVNVESQLNQSTPVMQESRPSIVAPSSGGMDFLTEMRLKMNKKVSGESSSSAKSNASKPAPTNTSNVITTPVEPIKTLSVNSETPCSTYVTAADLEKFRNVLMNDILSNMEKMKNEIISTITSRLH